MNAAATRKSLRWILNNAVEQNKDCKAAVVMLEKIEGNPIERLMGDVLNKLYRIRTMK